MRLKINVVLLSKNVYSHLEYTYILTAQENFKKLQENHGLKKCNAMK